jgi:hypothetical protein
VEGRASVLPLLFLPSTQKYLAHDCKKRAREGPPKKKFVIGYRAGGALLPLGDGAGQGLPAGLLADAPPLLLPDAEADGLGFEAPPFGVVPVIPGSVVPDPAAPGSVVPLVAAGAVPQGAALGELPGLFGLAVDG